MRLRPLLAAVLLLVASSTAMSSNPAQASTNLGRTSWSPKILVAQQAGKVFIASGTDAAPLRMTNLSGGGYTKLNNIVGVRAMALSGDGTTMYVSQGGQLAAVNTASLASEPIPLEEGVCAFDVAVVGDDLLFSHATNCRSSQGSASIGVVDLATNAVTYGIGGYWGRAPQLRAAGGSMPDAVVAVDGVAQRISVLELSEPVEGPLLTTVEETTAITYVTDVAVSPDGVEILLAYDGVTSIGVLQLADLTQVSHIAPAHSGGEATTVAVRADGVIATNNDSDSRLELYLDDGTSWRTYPFDGPTMAVAFGPTKLYAIHIDKSRTSSVLEVLTPASQSGLSVTTDHSLYQYGAKAKVTAKLASPGTNRQVSLFATPVGGRRTLVGSADVNGEGEVSFTAEVRKKTTFTAVYEGDTGADAAEAKKTVQVEAGVKVTLKGATGQDGRFALFPAPGRVVTVAKVSPDHSGQCVNFYVQRRIGTNYRSFGETDCVRLNARSKAAAYLNTRGLAGQRLRFQAIFAGDAVSFMGTSPWVYVRIVG